MRNKSAVNIKQRWCDLWLRLGAHSLPEPIFDELVHFYWQPHRAYHNLDHIQDCLNQFDQARILAERKNEVEMAVWCHDVIYDPRAADNEGQSAAWAAHILQLGEVAPEVSACVQALILVTRHQALPTYRDAALVADIDLSILGRPVAEFDRYEDAIRQEYQWIPEATYREARIKVLAAFLARRSVFQTQTFRDRYEAQASDNLTRSIRSLRTPR
jgi:predicted metal-dependent HD superfamily phosphohydrolase